MAHGHGALAVRLVHARRGGRPDGARRAGHGVTCPFIRYHPAIIAQAAATTALLSDGRFALGVGAGERLNEHVVGRGWPAVPVRHEMFRESLEIIWLLWSDGYRSYDGKHLKLEHARVWIFPRPRRPSPSRSQARSRPGSPPS